MEVTGRRPEYYSEEWDTGVPCDPCQRDNESENAQFYCTNCDEFLCDNCAIHHRKNKASVQHQLLDRDEMPRKKLSYVQEKFCAKHDGKLMEYFCDKHDICCCSVCVTLDHGQCGVKYIDDLAKDFSSSQEYKSLLKQIRNIENELTEYKNKTQNDSIDVTNSFRRLISDIQVFRGEINSKIDELERELMQQAEQIKEEDLKTIESVDTLYDKLQVDMSEISSTLGLLEQCKRNQQLFIAARTARTQVKEYKTKKMSQQNIVRRYAFLRNKNIMNTLNSHHKLGSLEMKNEIDRRTTNKEQTEKGLMKENKPNIGTLSIRKKEERGENQQTQKEEKTMKTDIFKPTIVKFLKDIKMNHKTDTTIVDITGGVLMYSDILAVADRSNKSIKVIDLRSDTITCYIKLGDCPWDITCTDPGTLVVTCNTNLVFLRYDGKSGFLRYNKTLTVVKKVPMESSCRGIAYRKGKLFVTFVEDDSPSVKLLNHEGKVLQTFNLNDKGQFLFSCPQYIAVNSDGDKMYVSDINQYTVTSLSMDGKVCNIYKHENLKQPAGLTLGDDDSMYVAGCWSHNIHQITPTCAPVRIVLEEKDGLIYPHTVLYNKTDKTLYVSSHSSGNLLNVYQLL